MMQGLQAFIVSFATVTVASLEGENIGWMFYSIFLDRRRNPWD